MKYAMIILLLLPTLLRAQEFQFRQEFDTIPVEIDGWRPFAPWTGGFSRSTLSFEDIDADGDLDIFIGGATRYIAYANNSGSAAVANFNWVTSQYDSLISVNAAGNSDPNFWDLDADGDFDAVIGAGYVTFAENLGTPEYPQFFAVAETLHTVSSVVVATRIALIYIDLDQDADLIAGYTGCLILYTNIGTPDSFSFELTSSPWLNINVGDKADPTFCDIDADGDYDLFIGNEIGKIYLYRNDGDSANYDFTYVTNNYNDIDVGEYASPEFADIDEDGDYDLFVGRENYSTSYSPGDVFFYENIGSPSMAQWILRTKDFLTLDEGLTSRNCGTDIDADLAVDIFLMNQGDHLSYFENVGDSLQGSFRFTTGSYQDISVGDGSPFFADIDGDRDPDLFIGEALVPNPPYPGLFLFQNTGTPQSATFSLYSNNLVPYPYHVAIRPTLADIDADGDKDLFTRDNNGVFYFFENIGSPMMPQFADPVLNWQGLSLAGSHWSCFYDIDDDGDLDYFITMANWTNDDFVGFYLNTGTPQQPNLVFQTNTFLQLEGGKFILQGIDVVDNDDDGDGDFLLGTAFSGGILFFRNVTGEPPAVPPLVRHPQAGFHLSLGPNPANPVTLITFSLPYPQEATLAVYNLLGARVTTLTSGL